MVRAPAPALADAQAEPLHPYNVVVRTSPAPPLLRTNPGLCSPNARTTGCPDAPSPAPVDRRRGRMASRFGCGVSAVRTAAACGYPRMSQSDSAWEPFSAGQRNSPIMTCGDSPLEAKEKPTVTVRRQPSRCFAGGNLNFDGPTPSLMGLPHSRVSLRYFTVTRKDDTSIRALSPLKKPRARRGVAY